MGNTPTATITIQRLLQDAFRRYGSETCLRWDDGQTTYAETYVAVSRLAAWLQANVSEPRHVAILLPNSREYIEAMLACALAGVVRVPLSTRDPNELHAKKLAQSESSVLITTSAAAAQLRAWTRGASAQVLVVDKDLAPERAWERYEDVVSTPAEGVVHLDAREGDRYRLSFTGGTTGDPKAVVQSHVQERAMIRNLLLEVISPGPGRCFVAGTPLAHAAGAFVMPTILRGGSISWLEKFDPVRIARPTWSGEANPALSIETFVVPTALKDLAEAATDAHSFSTVVYGGASCPQDVLDLAIGRFGGALVQVYGQAEAPVTVCVATGLDHVEGRVRQGWVGRPFLFVDVSTDVSGAADDNGEERGELIVRGEHVMVGYWNRPDETQEKMPTPGAIKTGDVATIHDDGSVSIVGRTRELIISGGFNVYPGDVEKRLAAISGVDVLSVFPLPHPRWGEAVALAITVKNGADPLDVSASVDARARTALADFERPKEVFVVDELPLTVVGKVSRDALTDRFRDHFTAPPDST